MDVSSGSQRSITGKATWIVLRLAHLFSVDCPTKWWISAQYWYFLGCDDLKDAFSRASREDFIFPSSPVCFQYSMESDAVLEPLAMTRCDYHFYYQYLMLYYRAQITLWAAFSDLQ